jgi:Gpi18-like mannosyltransferase
MKETFAKHSLTAAGIALILIGTGARLAGIWFLSHDMRVFLMPWYSQLAVHGFAALQTDFSNYTPPYLYLLWLATLTRGAIQQIIAIKLPSLLFDAGNAFWVYKILRVKYRAGAIPFLGAAVFFCLPTIVLNSAWWGQADSIYTFFLLACFYYFLRERPIPATILFAAAFSIKLQAMFFAPFLLLLLFKRRVAWTYALIVPLVYIVLILPAVLAGRPFVEAVTIYLEQADSFHQLTLNAPNLYLFVPDNWYTPFLFLGLGFTAILSLLWAIGYARRIKLLTPEIMLLCAAVCVTMLPFFLPKMHERYFYLADVFLLILAFYLPRLWVVPLASQVVSTLTYSLYLFVSFNPGQSPFGRGSPLLTAAALVNTALVAFLMWEQYRMVTTSQTKLSEFFLSSPLAGENLSRDKSLPREDDETDSVLK